MIQVLLLLCALLVFPGTATAAPLRISCVMDGDFATTIEQRNALLDSLRAQLTPYYSGVELPPDAQLSFSDATPETLVRVDTFCRELMQRTDINLILSFDLYSARALLRHNNGVTPVFLLSGDDPVSAGILPSRENSGASNVTASLRLESARKKIELFQKILHFKRLGLLYVDTPLGRVSSRYDEAQATAKAMGFELVAERITEVEAFTDCAAAVRRLAARQPDAFFMGSLLCMDPDNNNLTATLAPMTAAGIPSLAQDSPEQTHAGALLALTTDTTQLAKINTKKVLDTLQGQPPNSLPMTVPFDPWLSLNIAVASTLAFDPSYELIAASDTLFYNLRTKKRQPSPAAPE